MEQEKEDISLTDQIKEYTKTRIELATYSAVDKGSQLFANIVTDVIFAVCFLVALLLASFAAAYLISEKLGNTYSGFFIVAGFYLLIALIVFFTKDKYLEKPIVNAVIKKFFKERS
ncbi:MAG: phage holin family protein [Daejeonella sp.]